MRMRQFAVGAAILAVATPAAAQDLGRVLRGIGAVAGALSGRSTNARPANVLPNPQDAMGQRYAIEQFDILGVRLGMTPDEVRATMQQQGVPVGLELKSEDYAERLRDALQRRNVASPRGSQVTSTLSGTTAEGNHLMVNFVDGGSGPRASEVVLSLRGERSDNSRLREQLRQRYGSPTVTRNLDLCEWWCSAADQNCGNLIQSNAAYLRYDWFPGSTITLSNKFAMLDAQGRRIAADVERLAPRSRPRF